MSLGAHAQQTLTLEQCLDSARTYNRELKNAALEIERSREQKTAIYTKYFPEISASATAFYAFDKLIKGDGTYPEELAMLEPLMPGISGMVGQPYDFAELNRGYTATLTVMQPIYAGGQIHTKNQLSELELDVMRYQMALKEKEIAQKVTENYWQIAQLCYNLQTLDAADRQIAAIYNQVELYVKAGVTTRNELLKVQLHQQELKSNRLRVENGMRVLKLLLAQQCGLTHGLTDADGHIVDYDIVLPQDADLQPVQSVSSATAALQREEYLLAEKGVEAERLQVRLERGKCLPTVAVGVMGMQMGMGGLSDNAREIMHTSSTNGLVLGTVSVPISEWWTGKHAIRRQQLKVQEALNTRDDALEMLTIDIESAWSNLVEARQQVEVARDAVLQSEENLRQSTDKYKAGTEQLTDLLDAETLHRQSQNNLSSALAAYQVKLADYNRKVGL